MPPANRLKEALERYGSSAWLRDAMEEQDPSILIPIIQNHILSQIQSYLSRTQEYLAALPEARTSIVIETNKDIGRLAYALHLVSHPYSVERGLQRFLRWLEAHRF